MMYLKLGTLLLNILRLKYKRICQANSNTTTTHNTITGFNDNFINLTKVLPSDINPAPSLINYLII